MRALLVVLAFGLASCAIRPEAEEAERARAERVGAAFRDLFVLRELPELDAESDLDELRVHALSANGAVEAAWHRWIAALERVPQESMQPTTAMLGAEHRFGGGDALDRTMFQLATDAMNNVLLPGRLAAQGEAALARARVAAAEFDRERLRLVRELTSAYAELALRDEELQRVERLRAVLAADLPSVRARVRAGSAEQTELLAAEIALARVEADEARLREGRPALVEALRALVGARAEGVEFTATLAPIEALDRTSIQRLRAGLASNPLVALRRQEVAAAEAALEVREWERAPGFSLSAALSGDGITTLGGMFTLPFLRGTAIEAAIREAASEVDAARALRRQAGSDANAQFAADLALLRAIEAESAVLERNLLPALQQAARLARATWGTGQGALTAWARALGDSLDVERAALRLRAEHAVLRARLLETAGAWALARE